MSNPTKKEIAACYNEAVLALRRKVELAGTPWRDALRETVATHTLGLCQIADLEKCAKEKYDA